MQDHEEQGDAGRICQWVLVWWLAASLPAAAQGTGDEWLAGPAVYPVIPVLDASVKSPALFDSLQAEYLVDRLYLRWKAANADTNRALRLYVSVDQPGHWPARDWKWYRMTRRETRWSTAVPVDHVGLPLIYFLVQSLPGTPDRPGITNHSPMRICWPKRLGARSPTRLFWPFMEGFEQGLTSWKLLSDPVSGATMKLTPEAHDGKSGLEVTIPRGKRSVSIATTRIRGWQVIQQQATGVRLWLRGPDGPGRVRFTLFSNAFSRRQVMAACRRDVEVNDTWMQVDLGFDEFRSADLPQIDLLSIEFISAGPKRFLVDDLELTGRF